MITVCIPFIVSGFRIHYQQYHTDVLFLAIFCSFSCLHLYLKLIYKALLLNLHPLESLGGWLFSAICNPSDIFSKWGVGRGVCQWLISKHILKMFHGIINSYMSTFFDNIKYGQIGQGSAKQSLWSIHSEWSNFTKRPVNYLYCNVTDTASVYHTSYQTFMADFCDTK